MTVVLYADKFWISPYVFSCFVALTEKGVAFETRPISLGDKEQLRPEFRDGSITARVPAIEHDGFWLAESSAIVEYVDEVFAGPALLPREPRARARARQVMAWLRTDLSALRQERPTTSIFYEPATSPLSEAGQAAADKLVRVADQLLAEGATSLFEGFTIADFELAFMLYRLLRNKHELPAKIRAFVEAQAARPSVRAFVTQKRLPYVPYD